MCIPVFSFTVGSAIGHFSQHLRLMNPRILFNGLSVGYLVNGIFFYTFLFIGDYSICSGFASCLAHDDFFYPIIRDQFPIVICLALAGCLDVNSEKIPAWLALAIALVFVSFGFLHSRLALVLAAFLAVFGLYRYLRSRYKLKRFLTFSTSIMLVSLTVFSFAVLGGSASGRLVSSALRILPNSAAPIFAVIYPKLDETVIVSSATSDKSRWEALQAGFTYLSDDRTTTSLFPSKFHAPETLLAKDDKCSSLYLNSCTPRTHNAFLDVFVLFGPAAGVCFFSVMFLLLAKLRRKYPVLLFVMLFSCLGASIFLQPTFAVIVFLVLGFVKQSGHKRLSCT
jgi:uncharacterized membrane protein